MKDSNLERPNVGSEIPKPQEPITIKLEIKQIFPLELDDKYLIVCSIQFVGRKDELNMRILREELNSGDKCVFVDGKLISFPPGLINMCSITIL